MFVSTAFAAKTVPLPCGPAGLEDDPNYQVRRRLRLVFPLPSRLRHCLRLVLPLPSLLICRLSLVLPPPLRLRHRLWLRTYQAQMRAFAPHNASDIRTRPALLHKVRVLMPGRFSWPFLLLALGGGEMAFVGVGWR